MNAAISGQRSQSENLNGALDSLERFVHQARNALSHPIVDPEAAIRAATENVTQAMMSQILARFDALDRSIAGVNQKVGRLDQRVGRVEENVAAVDRKVDNLGRKLSYYDHNAIARVSNSGATKRNFELTALLNVETGEEISSFPATFGEADQLSGVLAPV
ncbi:uncharacterized protein NECHADRAFT_88854 [Fusarium vanettenii 77-13-4]|uniref:Uncharacterized protein n=1 Tax=Fusarium vanettenii (strain ATCC MYA-4622 / CBS 123669 / FGSC 9596 / NRRL 45880 / 77-13-4) TaxID=660122 RepID=C7ZN38_FUSV7|nr:uncharacterized protein NECHADRAFT_88854 [Fusarium vanettenii 77-13-4]EEU34554.1 predicted protein [Fusarium vanettenii 77-13-4]